MTRKTKRIIRYIMMTITSIILMNTLGMMGFGYGSGYFWAVIACYLAGSAISVREGNAIGYESIEGVYGKSPEYLYAVYVRVKETVRIHERRIYELSLKEKHMQLNSNEKILNQTTKHCCEYVLDISKAMLKEVE